jgi:hypothetical protein
LETFENELGADMTLGQCWELLCRTCTQFGFSGIQFVLDGEKHEWGVRNGWQARIDFPGHGFISVWRDSGTTNHGASAVLFIDCVSRNFNKKLSGLELVNND